MKFFKSKIFIGLFLLSITFSGSYLFAAIEDYEASGLTVQQAIQTALVDDLTELFTALGSSAGLAGSLSDETGSGAAVFGTSPTLVTPALGTIASGVGTALTALDGENIQDDTIDDDSIDFTDVTLTDLTFDVGSVSTTEFGYLNGVTANIQTQIGDVVSLEAIYSGDLAAAVSAIGATETLLKIDCAVTIASGTTVITPVTMSIQIVPREGSIDGVSGGGTETLTINGPLIAGLDQFIGDNVTVNGAIKCDYIRPEWWAENTTPGTTDMATAINSAIETAAASTGCNIVRFQRGRYRITDAIKMLQSVSLEGYGQLSGSGGGTEIYADFTSLTAPTDNYTDTYTAVLDYKPIIYNTELLTRCYIKNMRFDGGGADVYGIHFNEMYFFEMSNITIDDCNKAPFTFMRAQFNDFNQIAFNDCSAGARILGSSGCRFDGLNIERITLSGPVLDIIHDSTTKAGIDISGLWYEDPTGATYTGDWIRIGQKGVSFVGAQYINIISPNAQYIHLLSSSTSITHDGVSFTTVPCVNNELHGVNLQTSTGDLSIKLGTDVRRLSYTGDLSITSTSTVENNQVGVDKFVHGFEILDTDASTKVLHFEDASTINFGDNSNRKIYLDSGDLQLTNTYGRTRVEAGTTIPTIQLYGDYVEVKDQAGADGDWEAGLLKLSGNWLWFDSSNNLRYKSSLPSSDTDGTVIGP